MSVTNDVFRLGLYRGWLESRRWKLLPSQRAVTAPR